MSRQVVIGSDENVVHVDEQFVRILHFHFSKHSVHCSLEGGGGVGQSEEHDPWFEQSHRGFEGGLPFVAFFDPDIVVSPPYVELGEERSTLELFQDRFDQGERIVVVDRLFVQLSVVLDGSEFPILLFNEEEGGRIRRL